MKLVLKHIIRNIKEHKLRSLMILISVTIASLAFTLTLTLSDEVSVKIEQTLKTVYGDAEIYITNEENNIVLDDLDISKYKYRKTELSNNEVVVEYKNELEPSLLSGFNIKSAQEMNMLPNFNVKSNEVVVNKYTAEKFGYKVNDKIIIKVDDIEKEFIISEIIPKFGYASIENNYPSFFTSLENIKELKGEYTIDTMFFDLDDDNLKKEFVEHVSNIDDYYSSETYSAESIADGIAMINSLIIIIFIITVLMIFFVMSSLSKLIIAERMPVIGTFRSVGASKNRMNAILLLENIVYAIIGGFIGSMLGYYASRAISKVFITTDGISLTNKTASIDFKVILIGIIFAVILEVLISLKSILKANKKPIKDIIFNTQRTRYIIKYKKIVIGILFLIASIVLNVIFKDNNFLLSMLCTVLLVISSVYLTPVIIRAFCKVISIIAKKFNLQITLISTLNTMYSKMIISSVILMVISMTSMFAILSISNTFGKMFESFRYIYDMDLIAVNVSKDFNEYDKLKNIDGVENIYPSYYIMYQGTTSNINLTMMPLFMGLNDSQKGIDEYDYKVKDLKDNEILVDKAYAKKNNIKIGDTIDFTIEEIDKDFSLKVVGFNNSLYFTTTRNVIIMTEENYIKIFGGVPTWLVIYTDDNVDVDKLKEEIKDTIGEINAEVISFEDYINNQEEQTESIMSIFYIIIGLAVVLSIVGVVNNQIISFMQRKRELAVLNSTCMSRKQLSMMLLLEVIISCIISIIIAILNSIIMIEILENVLKAMSMYFELSIDIKYILGLSSAMLILLVIVSFIPMRKIKKLDIVKEIKYE